MAKLFVTSLHQTRPSCEFVRVKSKTCVSAVGRSISKSEDIWFEQILRGNIRFIWSAVNI